MGAIVAPLAIGPEVLDRGLDLDDPQRAVTAERGQVSAPAGGQGEFRHHGKVQGSEKPRRTAGDGKRTLRLAAVDRRNTGGDGGSWHGRIMPRAVGE